MKAAEISIEDLPLRYEVGDSVVEQFALSHTPTDILRELVQNEYDAEGRELGVHFGSDRLVITGNGNPIDAAGWERLRVMLGTGWVQNFEAYVEPKQSSIGSKNFGLRSLFTVGDEIWVFSGGKWSVLHCRRGALYPPREDQDPPRRGVRIEVPYRHSKMGALEPFTPDRRSAWVHEIGRSVAATLIKLAHPNRSRGLRRVVLSAENGMNISWEQRAKELPAPRRGIKLIRRQVMQTSAGHRESFVDLEYQKRIQIPGSYRQKDFPAYFRTNRNRVWLGVSLRLKRGRPDENSPGLVYYPLGGPLARTGNLVSLNAPFEMDNNRANIVSPLTSSWNQWLLQESAEFTVRLLTTDWYQRFGSGAYLAVNGRESESGSDLIEAYADSVIDCLRNDEIWASSGRNRRKVTFVSADALVLPIKPEFDGFFDPKDYLDKKLARNEPVIRLSLDCGAQYFGPDSLVRLRCAGEDASMLCTQPNDNDQGDWFFDDFDLLIRDLPMQVKFAQALDKIRLTANHRADLLDTATTLAADGSLQALSEPLYIVPPEGWEACPVPLNQRLHSDLAEFKSLRRLAKKFNMTAWIRSTARRTQEGQATDEERRALMKVILTRKGSFDAGTLGLLRKSPVLPDHLGRWVEPREITLRNARGARALAPVLSFPARSYSKDSELGRRLSFRSEIDGEDLVNMAEWVSKQPEMAGKFEATLFRRLSLLRAGQWKRLREIKCLRSSGGTIEAPQDLYIRTRATLELFGDRVLYAEGPNRLLHEKMGCNVLPKSTDIIADIERNRRDGSPTADTHYVALLEALRRERRPFTTYTNEAIVWTQGGYASPSRTLVSPALADLLIDAVAVAKPRSEKAASALRSLGCRMRPNPNDWAQLVALISKSVGGHGIVSKIDRRRLLRAYAELRDGLPDGVELNGKPYVLGRDGRLHEPSQAFIDDNPQLAELLSVKVPIAEDSIQAALRFYDSSGVKRLSEAAILSRTQTGEPQDEPSRLGVTKAKRQLGSKVFRSALLALINREISDRPGLAVGLQSYSLMPRIDSIVFVNTISHSYQLAGENVNLSADHHWDGTTLYVVSPQGRTAFRDTVSYALAEIITGSLSRARMIAPAIYRLLECNSTEEIADFLTRRGIPWRSTSAFELWETVSQPYLPEGHNRQDDESIADQIGDTLTANLKRRADRTSSGSSGSSGRSRPTEARPERRTLPDTRQ